MSTNPEREEQKRKVLLLRKSPDIFIEKMLGADLVDFQKEVCKFFSEYDRLNIKACHAVGKTFLMGRLALSFLYLYPSSVVITTAPTHRQVVTLLWGEIRKAKKNALVALEGKLIENKLTIDDDHYAMGFSPQKGASNDSNAQQGSSFQGFHAENILIIFDEAVGVSRDMFTMAEGLLTSGKVVKWVCIANPTSRSCEFFKNTKLAEWYTHSIDCFKSPNMIANGFTNKSELKKEIDYLKTLTDVERLDRIKNYAKPDINLINAQWVVAKVYQWGFEHPLAKSKIFSEFPSSEENTIIKYESLQAAFNRENPEPLKSDTRYIGVDVARFGKDSTVFTDLVGYKYISKEVHNLKRTTEITGDAIAYYRKTAIPGQETYIIVDGTGVGAGVVDGLEDAVRNHILPSCVFIIEVHFAQAVTHPNEKEQEELRKNYENLKAYMFFQLNSDLADHLDLPQEEIYDEELPAILFEYTTKARIKVMSKEDFAALYGKSPDHADSLALANVGRYLKHRYGSFSTGAQNTENKPLLKRTTKSDLNKRTESRIKVKEY